MVMVSADQRESFQQIFNLLMHGSFSISTVKLVAKNNNGRIISFCFHLFKVCKSTVCQLCTAMKFRGEALFQTFVVDRRC